MCIAIKINQPSNVGSMILSFEEEGKARLTVEAINAAGDPRTTAEYIGRANRTHLTFAPSKAIDATSLRRQAMESYDRALPHRVALDVIDLQATDETLMEYACYVLGGWRPKTEA